MQPHKTKILEVIENCKLIIYGKDSTYTYPDNVLLLHKGQEKKVWIKAPVFRSEKMIHGVKNELYSTPKRDVWLIQPHKDVIKNFWGKVTGEHPHQGCIEGYKGTKTIGGKTYVELIISDGGMNFEFQYLDLYTCQFMDLGIWGGRF